MTFSFREFSGRLEEALKRRVKLVGTESRNQLVARVQSGLDRQGVSFAPYSSEYRKFKAKSGRQVDPVNLTFRFQMLRALSVQELSGEGQIGFDIIFLSAKEREKAQNNINNGRDFFGLTRQESDNVVMKLKEAIGEIL